jgi:hypothetical protein
MRFDKSGAIVPHIEAVVASLARGTPR